MLKKTRNLDYVKINELMADFRVLFLSIFSEFSILHMHCSCNKEKKEKIE